MERLPIQHHGHTISEITSTVTFLEAIVIALRIDAACEARSPAGDCTKCISDQEDIGRTVQYLIDQDSYTVDEVSMQGLHWMPLWLIKVLLTSARIIITSARHVQPAITIDEGDALGKQTPDLQTPTRKNQNRGSTTARAPEECRVKPTDDTRKHAKKKLSLSNRTAQKASPAITKPTPL
jgi:hypothetical protein